ncbi:oxygenase MpaB family protein [Streptomyces chartreusis]
MTSTVDRRRRIGPESKITKADILGTERRWRRGQAPVPAGQSVKEDGTPDYGIFGPGSMVWEVLLHPAMILFHHAAQQQSQAAYAPIEAGIRDWEPISKKGRAGKLTFFDAFERLSRGAGMHLPLWLGDTATAEHMAAWLHKVHSRVKGDIIDITRPELGGYDAAGPRESMWAALTEMHPMLRSFEAFAFREGKRPHRLTPAQRDQFIAEVAAYCRLHGAPEDEIPTSMAELATLYGKYAPLFEHSDTVHLIPETGEDYTKINEKSIRKNFNLSHLRAIRPILMAHLLLAKPVLGAMPSKTRDALGLSPRQSRAAVRASKLALPLAWLLQRRFIERHYMRIMWGPDGVMLIESARKLHAQAKAAQPDTR